MLEIRSLAVRYGHVVAVGGVDLDVGAGEAIGLLGPNGAGKTSMLRAVSRLVPSQGEVVFDGERIDGRSVEDIADRGLIHVPEGRRVFASLTVHENLEIGRSARRGRRGGYSLDDIYDLFPLLAPLAGRSGWSLSGGEQQMVAIGRALAAAPRMLLLDEPSLGLAPIVARAVFAAIEEVRATVPILLVEQNTDMALAVTSRAYVLASGEIVMAGSSAELGDRQALMDSYLGQRDIHHTPPADPGTRHR